MSWWNSLTFAEREILAMAGTLFIVVTLILVLASLSLRKGR